MIPSVGSAIETPCRSVDSICEGYGSGSTSSRSTLKGAEQLIFRGMSALLMRCKPDIILEFNYLRYDQPHQFIAEIMAHYPVLRYLNRRGVIKNVTIPQLQTEQAWRRLAAFPLNSVR